MPAAPHRREANECQKWDFVPKLPFFALGISTDRNRHLIVAAAVAAVGQSGNHRRADCFRPFAQKEQCQPWDLPNFLSF